MKTQEEIEVGICEAISRVEQVEMGRGPRTFTPTCSATSSVVRLQAVLTAAIRERVRHRAANGGAFKVAALAGNVGDSGRKSETGEPQA